MKRAGRRRLKPGIAGCARRIPRDRLAGGCPQCGIGEGLLHADPEYASQCRASGRSRAPDRPDPFASGYHVRGSVCLKRWLRARDHTGPPRQFRVQSDLIVMAFQAIGTRWICAHRSATGSGDIVRLNFSRGIHDDLALSIRGTTIAAVANDPGQGILSRPYGIHSLYTAYMPFIKNGGLFIPTATQYRLGDEVFLVLSLMDARKAAVAGKIVWITPPSAVATARRASGVALERHGQGRDVAARFETLLGTLLKSGARPTPCSRRPGGRNHGLSRRPAQSRHPVAHPTGGAHSAHARRLPLPSGRCSISTRREASRRAPRRAGHAVERSCVSVDLDSYPAVLALGAPACRLSASVGVHPISRPTKNRPPTPSRRWPAIPGWSRSGRPASTTIGAPAT